MQDRTFRSSSERDGILWRPIPRVAPRCQCSCDAAIDSLASGCTPRASCQQEPSMTNATLQSLRRVETFRAPLIRYAPQLRVEEDAPVVLGGDLRTGRELLSTATAVIPMPDREMLVVGGRDHRKVLQGLLTNDVISLTTGHGCYAALLT